MLNQFRRIWADNGSGDKDFTADEMRLKEALTELKRSADQLSRASSALLSLIRSGSQPAPPIR